MKRITALILSLISVLCFLTACSNLPLSLDGRYWQGSVLNGDIPINETCIYDVKVVNSIPSNSTEVKNNLASLVIEEGTFTTHLYNGVYNNNECYVYESTLSIQGKYVIGENEFPINDYTVSKTYLKKFHQYLNPYYSEKEVSNNTLIVSSNAHVVKNYQYKYTIEYGDKAVVNFTPLNDTDGNLNHLKGKFEYANYNDGAFVDNEVIFFIPRAFNLTANYSQSFKTVDAVSKSLQNCSYTTGSESSLDVKTFILPSYTYNDTLEENKSIQAAKLLIKLTDKYDGANIECYYATDYETMCHRLIKRYTTLNSNLGYIEYSLKEVVYK